MKAKYIEERFPEWYVSPGGYDDRNNVLLDDGTGMLGSVHPEDAEELVNRHNSAVQMIHKLAALACQAAPEEFKSLWYGETK